MTVNAADPEEIIQESQTISAHITVSDVTELHNSSVVSDSAVCLATECDSNGVILSIQCKPIKNQSSVSFTFGKEADSYRLMYWDSFGSMLPISRSYSSIPAE